MNHIIERGNMIKQFHLNKAMKFENHNLKICKEIEHMQLEKSNKKSSRS